LKAFDGHYGIKLGLSDFLNIYKSENLEFISACGFEDRAPAVFQKLALRWPQKKVSCTIIDLLNRNDPAYRKARSLQRSNITRVQQDAQKCAWSFRQIKANLYSKTPIAHEPVVKHLLERLRRFSGDFLVDISCMPRSIVFPVLWVLWNSNHVRNLVVAFTEDTSVGALETQAADFRSPKYLPYFRERNPVGFSVWMPILGGDVRPTEKIKAYMRFNDVYPVVGFPSTRPIETDEIVRLNRGIIGQHTGHLIFASMNDPFHLSMKLNSEVDGLRSSFGKDIRIILSPHGSKPQSIGAFLTAVMERTGVLYCQPLSYKTLPGSVGSSYVYWLKGTPYGGRQ
jgi:hypothetical protein